MVTKVRRLDFPFLSLKKPSYYLKSRDTYSQHAKSSALRGTATMLGPGMMARRSR